MQQSVGEIIRQLRRQRSLTQTELGRDRFSKSYVSAVERDKIAPSPEALRYFAGQLEQSHDYFLLLAQKNVHELRVTAMSGHANRVSTYEEVAALLGTLLDSVEQSTTFILPELPLLSAEAIAALPKNEQARYALLMGVVARQKQDPMSALAAFEQAVALASSEQQPVILSEIGASYYQLQEYETALTYHKRALNHLQDKAFTGAAPAVRLKVHLYCAHTYQALGVYKQASSHYEQARGYLNSTYDIKTAAQIYMGLGYCIYASVYQNTMPPDSAMPSLQQMNIEEMEHEFQSALSFIMQGRMLYHACGDSIGDSAARLVQVMVLLDLCVRRQQFLSEKNSAALQVNCASYLKDAEEQCRQVLLLWQETFTASAQAAHALERQLYIALAYLTRVFVLRAVHARLGNDKDTAERELARATLLCQRILDALNEPHRLQDLVRNSIHFPEGDVAGHSLPLLDTLQLAQFQPDGHGALPLGVLEVYFAAGEVMEELGYRAIDSHTARNYYKKANQCFRVTLPIYPLQATSHASMIDDTYDTTDGTRRYQRYISVLEKRLHAKPVLAEETIKTLLGVLKEGLSLSQVADLL